MTITFDAEVIILVVALIAGRFEDGTELVDSRETVLQSLFYGLGCPLLLVLAHDTIDDFLRVYSFVVVINLVTIGGNSARHYMNMVVVSIVVGIDEQGLAFLTISHFFEIPMGDVQKLFVGVFVTSAGDSEVELGLLDALVILISVIEKLLFQVIGGVLLVNEVETFYLQQFCNAL